MQVLKSHQASVNVLDRELRDFRWLASGQSGLAAAKASTDGVE